MIDWELSSIDFWVSFGESKPFPVTIYKKGAEWTFDLYPIEALTPKQQAAVVEFVRERKRDVAELWKPNMNTRLSWRPEHLRRKSKER